MINSNTAILMTTEIFAAKGINVVEATSTPVDVTITFDYNGEKGGFKIKLQDEDFTAYELAHHVLSYTDYLLFPTE